MGRVPLSGPLACAAMTPIDRFRRLARRALLGPQEPKPTPIERGLLTMGRHSYDMPTVHHYDGGDAVVHVGNFCSIAKDVEFLPGGNHHTDRVTTYPIRRRFQMAGLEVDDPATSDVHVGNDVWIGRGARIVGPVTISDGAVIAAYSVVAKDVAAYTLVAGAPAAVKRRRFPDDICEALQRIAWWDWPDEVILGRVDDLMSPDIAGFVAKYSNSM